MVPKNNIRGISVIGLGKLGLCSAACFAAGGFKVWGVEIDPERVERINRGDNPVRETGLTELLRKVAPRLRATTDYAEAIRKTDATFIIVSTPSRPDGTFSNRQVEAALREISRPLQEKKSYHLVVITSTVMPGTTDGWARPLLEKLTGKTCGVDFGLAYNPEFIALGSVLRDFQNPDFLLIGECSPRDGDILEYIYRKVCRNDPPFARLSLLNAEIAKICLNCYVTLKISFANALGAICEAIPGADANRITGAIGLDGRIGKKYFRAGLGFGGPCFPRDNRAFSAFARKAGKRALLSELVDRINREQAERIVSLARSQVRPGAKVAVLGLAYKPDTPIIEESQAVDIARALKKAGFRVAVYDPQAMDTAREEEGAAFDYSESLEECLRGSSLCLITTPWKEFRAIEPDTLKALMKTPAVIDCWRVLDGKDLSGITYLPLGKG